MYSAWSVTAAQSRGFASWTLTPADLHYFTFGKAVCISRHEAGSANVGVERIGSVQVLLAEVGFLQGIVLNRARKLMRVGGLCRLTLDFLRFVARHREQDESASKRERHESIDSPELGSLASVSFHRNSSLLGRLAIVSQQPRTSGTCGVSEDPLEYELSWHLNGWR